MSVPICDTRLPLGDGGWVVARCRLQDHASLVDVDSVVRVVKVTGFVASGGTLVEAVLPRAEVVTRA